MESIKAGGAETDAAGLKEREKSSVARRYFKSVKA